MGLAASGQTDLAVQLTSLFSTRRRNSDVALASYFGAFASLRFGSLKTIPCCGCRVLCVGTMSSDVLCCSVFHTLFACFLALDSPAVNDLSSDKTM